MLLLSAFIYLFVSVSFCIFVLKNQSQEGEQLMLGKRAS